MCIAAKVGRRLPDDFLTVFVGSNAFLNFFFLNLIPVSGFNPRIVHDPPRSPAPEASAIGNIVHGKGGGRDGYPTPCKRCVNATGLLPGGDYCVGGDNRFHERSRARCTVGAPVMNGPGASARAHVACRQPCQARAPHSPSLAQYNSTHTPHYPACRPKQNTHKTNIMLIFFFFSIIRPDFSFDPNGFTQLLRTGKLAI